MASALAHLRKSGKAKSVVVPCCGAFGLVRAAIEGGVPVEKVHASDIGLFSSIIGFVASGRDLSEMPFEPHEKSTIGGHEFEVAEMWSGAPDDLARGARLMWLMKLAQLNPQIEYERMVFDEIFMGREAYQKQARDELEEITASIRGLRYEIADMAHVYRRKHPEGSVLLINPPAFAGGYEKMFPIERIGRWSVEFQEWTMASYHDDYRDTKARHGFPVFWLRHGDTDGIPKGDAVFAKEYSKGRYKYWLCTQPETLDGFDGKFQIDHNSRQDVEPYRNLPIWKEDEEMDAEMPVQIVRVEERHALYYRDLWAHRLDNTKAEMYYLILIDGKVFGTVGFYYATLRFNRDNKAFEVFGFSAPSKRYPNNGRLLMHLITMTAMKELLLGTMGKNRLFYLDGIATTCLSKYRHVKLNSGLLEVTHREK